MNICPKCLTRLRPLAFHGCDCSQCTKIRGSSEPSLHEVDPDILACPECGHGAHIDFWANQDYNLLLAITGKRSLQEATHFRKLLQEDSHA